MTYTAAAKKLMLDALKGTNPGTPITHIGAFDDVGAPLTAVTGVTSTDTFTKTAHGAAAGDIAVVSALTGGSGLVAGRVYFVIATGLTANDFRLALAAGGSAVDLGTDVSAATVTLYREITGGSPAYARKAMAFNAAADPGTMDDSTNGGSVFDIPAATDVAALGLFSAVTAGTLLDFVPVTKETYAGQGTYTPTDYDLDLLATG
jgi:hypothetical protein